MQALAVSCEAPPFDSLTVPDGIQLLSVTGSGVIRYFCNNNTLDPGDGEPFATLRSDDGAWQGYFTYPVDGAMMGLPHWWLNNTLTGETRTIYGENKPQVKKLSPTGADMSWSRRVIYGDVSSLDLLAADNATVVPAGPKARYVVRTDTTTDGKPQSATCSGDIDVDVPFTARYTFYSCDWWLVPPTIAPAPGLAAAAPAPTPAPDTAAALALAADLLLGPAPAPAPAAAEPVPQLVVLAAPPAFAPARSMALAAPPPQSGGVTSLAGVATVATAAAAAALL